jgi:hypothetical protein
MLDTRTFLFSQIVILAFFSYFILILFWRKAILFNGREMVSVILAFTLISSLTLNIDRSRSVFLIKWVSILSVANPVTLNSIVEFKNLPSSEIFAIQQRLDEQQQVGMIRKKDSGYELTFRGDIFIKFSNLLAKALNLEGFKSA